MLEKCGLRCSNNGTLSSSNGPRQLPLCSAGCLCVVGKDGDYWQLQDYSGPHDTVGQRRILEAMYSVILGGRGRKIRVQGHPWLHSELKASLG